MLSFAGRAALTWILWCIFAVLTACPSFGARLILSPGANKALVALYAQVTKGTLDLSPFYSAAGISVSNGICDATSQGTGPRSCASAPCPMANLLQLQISCLYPRHEGIDRSDLLIAAPYPVRSSRGLQRGLEYLSV